MAFLSEPDVTKLLRRSNGSREKRNTTNDGRKPRNDLILIKILVHSLPDGQSCENDWCISIGLYPSLPMISVRAWAALLRIQKCKKTIKILFKSHSLVDGLHEAPFLYWNWNSRHYSFRYGQIRALTAHLGRVQSDRYVPDMVRLRIYFSVWLAE